MPDLLQTRFAVHRDEQSLTQFLPVRVAVVSDALAERNGVGTYYQDLVQQLESRVARITLIAPAPAVKARHEWFTVPMPGDATQRLACPRPHRLDRMIREISPHALILPTLGAYAWFALRIARRQGLRVCMAHHTDFEKLVDLYWNRWLAVPAHSVLRSLTNFLVRGADVVAAMKVEALEDARRRGARQVRQMGTPLGTDFLREPRQPLGMHPPRILFLGRLAEEKGIDQVLQAARELPQFQFRIGGDGPLRARVVRTAGEIPNLEYLGWLRRVEVVQALDRSDMLVLPSRMETFGTVVLEALARHRLVLVSRQCGIVDWPDLAQGLFTFDVDEGLTGALRRVAGLSCRQQQAIASRSWQAVEQFNEQTIQGWLELLADVTGLTPVLQANSPAS